MPPSDKRTRLAAACEPFFLYLASFRRNSATSRAGLTELTKGITRALDKARSNCETEHRLGDLYKRVHYALVATADQVVLGSNWSQRVAWGVNLLETQLFGRAQGGSSFYKLCDEVLGDPSDDAAEVAEVLFQCMALGFQGELLNERAQLERRRRQLFEKARLPGALGSPICPEAYGQNASGADDALPTVKILRLIGVALAALVFAALAGTAAQHYTSQELIDALNLRIKKLDPDETSARPLTGQVGPVISNQGSSAPQVESQ